jgi:hypothetical protein
MALACPRTIDRTLKPFPDFLSVKGFFVARMGFGFNLKFKIQNLKFGLSLRKAE